MNNGHQGIVIIQGRWASRGGGRPGAVSVQGRWAFRDGEFSGKEAMSRKKGIPVLLTIIGRQKDPEGRTQENASVYEAVYTEEDGGAGGRRHLFRYAMEDGEAVLSLMGDGYAPPSLTSKRRGGPGGEKARPKGGNAFIERKNGTRMVFAPDEPFTECGYITPFGVIPMKIRTERVAVLGGGSSLKARIRYRLCPDDGYELECTATVRAEPLPERRNGNSLDGSAAVPAT